MKTAPIPAGIKLRRQSRLLELTYADCTRLELPCEYLRVFSPSAEVRGHGLAEPLLVPGKREVNISRIEPVGHYAVRLVFDDGHDTGLYTWEFLREMGAHHESNWARYLERMTAHGMSRDRDVVALSALARKYVPPAA